MQPGRHLLALPTHSRLARLVGPAFLYSLILVYDYEVTVPQCLLIQNCHALWVIDFICLFNLVNVYIGWGQRRKFHQNNGFVCKMSTIMLFKL